MPLEVTTNFKDSNGVDLGTKLVTKDYLISVYSSIAQEIGVTPELWVWGNNSAGQLGNGSVLFGAGQSTPITTISGGSTWKQISASITHAAAIKTDGTLWVWGRNLKGQLGTPPPNTSSYDISNPITTFAGGTNWKQVSCSNDFTAAIKTDGTLWTWGNGVNNRLGVPENFILYSYTPTTTFAGGTTWADTATGVAEELYTLSAGYRNSSAIKTDGTLWTWGYGSTSLGINLAGSLIVDTPVTTFAGGTTWKQISNSNGSAGYSTASVKTDGTLWLWGNNNTGQLGDNTTTSRRTPVTTFTGGTNWKQVSCSYRHTAAVKTDGTLWTWGNNSNAQLGRLFGTTIAFPMIISRTWADTATGAANELYTFSAGKLHSAGIKTDGTLWTWGNNSYGVGSSRQLGNGQTTDSSTPITTFAGGTTWKQVSVGYYHTAAIKTDGTLWTWGNNNVGKLGDNSTTNRSTPITTFAGGTTWKQVACGSDHTVAVKTDGTLWAWGSNGFAQIGDNVNLNRLTPVTTFIGGTTWSQVSAGTNHSAAVKTDGTLWVWGSNLSMQLGINALSSNTKSTPVTTFAGGTTWTQVSCGSIHTAAVKSDGTLWTWGYQGNGRLGNGVTLTPRPSTPVTTFAGGTTWKQVSSGGSHTAAVKTDGTLWTWGLNSAGQLGTNDTTSTSTPVTTFAGGTTWKQVNAAMGGNHTIALRDDGTTKELFSFGNNIRGQLGCAVSQNIPGEVQSYSGLIWKHVSCGSIHTAAVKTDGTLWVWGTNTNVQLGVNDASNRSTPVTTFAGGTTWKQVSCGPIHTTSVKTDGTLWTWGNNGSGRLGDNSTTNKSTPVTTFIGGTTWKQVSAGNAFTSAVKTDGTLWTWGSNLYGQLGVNDTTNTNRLTPVTTFAGGTTWKQVSCGLRQTLVLSDNAVNKVLYVFGGNNLGELGTRISVYNPVTTFAGGTNWKQVSGGYTHTAAVKTDGTLWTWGLGGSGRLGNNDTIGEAKLTPVTTFSGGTTWKQVSTGRDHTAAIKTDGTLWGWGSNATRQLGNNSTTTFIYTPVTTFSGGTNWKQVSCGGYYTAAVKNDGTLWAWGNNINVQLGNNATTTYVSTPVTTFAGGNNWKQVSCASGNQLLGRTAAIKTDGTLWLWGNNYRGSLGTNDAINRSSPVTTFAGGTNWKQVSGSSISTFAIKSTDII